MANKRIEAGQARRRAINAPVYVANSDDNTVSVIEHR
jgi:DNA-binding beta-propeller fold protein YncE